MSDSDGTSLGAILYAPYGGTRSGSVPTDIKFTGQKLDGTGLCYFRKPSVGPANPNPSVVANSPLTLTGLWSGRYYDPVIGRFISPDTIVPYPANPQSLNRYSYVYNNPLTYRDEDGHFGPLAFVALGGAVFAIIAIIATYSVSSSPQDKELREAINHAVAMVAEKVSSAVETVRGYLH
ncbi:MAG: RHS repeat-associated core domain-containing protein [Chloroflexi bacterium]|nr:RHS repeat-associated core domain-containing protein [Chloroflexota bacterium]